MSDNFKKTDLLKFQQSLNEQFMSIFNTKDELNISGLSSDTLGLVVVYREIMIFIPLNDLQNIGSQIKIENSIKTHSWIQGFNHEHGSLFTILNFYKCLDLIFFNKKDFDLSNITVNSNILYIKQDTEDSYALFVEDYKLEYTAEFTPIIERVVSDNTYKFLVNEDIDLEVFLNKKFMSNFEWETVECFNKLVKSGESINNDFRPNLDGNINAFTHFIKKIYLDQQGQRPIFVIDPINLHNFLANITPF